MKRKTLFIAASAFAMTAAAIAYAADGGYMPGLPSSAPAGAPPGRGGPARAPAAATAQTAAPGAPQTASGVVTSSPDVLESAVSREMNDMSNDAARTVMKNEINSRVVDSQVTLMKKQAELARAAADVAKARGDTTAANKQTALDAGATPGGQPQQATLPAMSVVWIAGASDNPEAQIKIAKYGSVVVRKGSRVPATVNMTVDKIDSHGILIKDATGQLYPVSFGG